MARASLTKPLWRRRLVLTVQILIGLAVAGFIALVIAVYVARASLPSFEELKSSPNGQMIRVHAADGTVIASLGPSFGDWLPYVLWKLERHGGVRLELTQRQQRYPLVFGWPVILRLLRQRTLR